MDSSRVHDTRLLGLLDAMTYIRSNPPVVLCLGDSISDYTYFSQNMYPGYLGRYLSGAKAVSCGVAGNKTTDILTNRLTNTGVETYNYFLGPTDPGATFSIGQICYVLIGINDLIFSQPSAAQLWSNIQSIYSQLQNKYGMVVRPMTISPFGSHQPGTFVILNNNATAGSITVSYGGVAASSIPWNATAAQLATAVGNISGIGSSNVIGSGGPLPGSPITLTFSIALNSAFSISSALTGDTANMAVGWTAYNETVRQTIRTNILASGLRYTDLESMGNGNGSQPALQAVYDSGDGLHPSALGGKQMAVLAALA